MDMVWFYVFVLWAGGITEVHLIRLHACAQTVRSTNLCRLAEEDLPCHSYRMQSLKHWKSYAVWKAISPKSVTNDMPKLTYGAIIYNIQCLHAARP